MRTARIKDGYGIIQRDIMKADISVYAKSVYCLLVSYAGNDESCFPSLKTICDDLQISKPTVIKGLKDLIAIGFIEANKRQTIQGDYASNVYYPMYIMHEKRVVNEIDNPVNDIDNVVKEVDTKNNIEDNSLSNDKENINKEPKDDDKNNTEIKQKKVAPKKSKKPFVLMRDSIEFNIETVKFNFFGTIYSKANIEYYYEAALAWSDAKNNTSANWMATIRNFMLKDIKANCLVCGELSAEQKITGIKQAIANWDDI